MSQPDEVLFNRESYTLLLSIDSESLDVPGYVTDQAKKASLIEKGEFHITIFGFGAAKKIEEALKAKPDKIEDFIEIVVGMEWFFEFKQEFYTIKKSYKINNIPEERRSIIMAVDVSGLNNLFSSINDLLGINLDIPPVHVTLFTKSSLPENNQSGIGLSSQRDFYNLKPKAIFSPIFGMGEYKAIALPTRPQPDTIVAILLLKRLGKDRLKGIEDAMYIHLPRLPEEETEESIIDQGIFLLDVGGGQFDHHNKFVQTTVSHIVAEYLEVGNNPSVSKLLQYAERDDFYGKGTVSTDPLDRAFGLSGLISALNKKYVDNPEMVIDLILPILGAFLDEEEKRTFEMPKELKEKLENGHAREFSVIQKNKKLRCIFIETNNTSMAGFLRSKNGGGFDVVALKLSSGHINILTRPIQRVDLRSLAVLIRLQEAEARNNMIDGSPQDLSVPGTLKEVTQWYYDPATNSLLNGGPNPQNIEPTAIDPMEFLKILELGLSEKLWSPSR
jgi:hypothetical protein